MARIRAQLSPNEETTLRRIAGDTASRDDLRDADIKRLMALGLVQEIDDELTVTKNGLERCSGLAADVTRPAMRRRLKRRDLPF